MEDLLKRVMEISRADRLDEKLDTYKYTGVGVQKQGGSFDIVLAGQLPAMSKLIASTEDETEAVETARKLASALDIDFKGLMEGKVPEEGKDDEATKIKKLTEQDGKSIDKFELQLEELMYDTMEKLAKLGQSEVDILSNLKDVLQRKTQEVEDYPEHPWGRSESKVNEQDDEEPPVSEPPAPKEEEPTIIKPAEEEAPEIVKELVGSTEDTFFYMLSAEDDLGEVSDLNIVDQEGVEKFSAKEHGLELTNVPEFLFKAIKELEIQEIEFGIFDRYLFPYVFEEEEPEDEEEDVLDDELEKQEEGPEDLPKESKVNEKLVPNQEDVLFIQRSGFEEGWDILKTQEGSNSASVIFTFDDGAEAERAAIGIAQAVGGKYNKEGDPRKGAVESKKHLIEMKITDHENNTFDVYLSDDGTMDTVIDVNGREFRFDAEFASFWRDEEGVLSEEGLRELALDALSNLEEDDYNELVARGAEAEEEPELDISQTDEGKFYVTKGEENVGGPYDTEDEAHDYIAKHESKSEPAEEKCDKDHKKEEVKEDAGGYGPRDTVKLVRKASTDEWVVRYYEDGVYSEDKTYYTDDKEDAEETMADIQARIAAAQDAAVGEKKSPPTCDKCNKAHWPFDKCDGAKVEEEGEAEAGIPIDWREKGTVARELYSKTYDELSDEEKEDVDKEYRKRQGRESKQEMDEEVEATIPEQARQYAYNQLKDTGIAYVELQKRLQDKFGLDTQESEDAVHWALGKLGETRTNECVCHIYDMPDDKLIHFYESMHEGYRDKEGKRFATYENDKAEVRKEIEKRGLDVPVVESLEESKSEAKMNESRVLVSVPTGEPFTDNVDEYLKDTLGFGFISGGGGSFDYQGQGSISDIRKRINREFPEAVGKISVGEPYNESSAEREKSVIPHYGPTCYNCGAQMYEKADTYACSDCGLVIEREVKEQKVEAKKEPTVTDALHRKDATELTQSLLDMFRN